MNVLDEVSDEPSPGYVEFKLDGKTQRLDVVGDDDGLFMIFRDDTAGKTTYKPGRFLYVEKKPEPNKTFKLDLNRAYNPPCAFSEYTTCPLPPEQNILKVKVEAGEKFPPKRARLASVKPRADTETGALSYAHDASNLRRAGLRRSHRRCPPSPPMQPRLAAAAGGARAHGASCRR